MTEDQMQKDHDILVEVHTNVAAILEQCKKTNGRITALESWRNYIAGGLALFCLLGLPMMWIMMNDVKQDSKDLQTHIVQTK